LIAAIGGSNFVVGMQAAFAGQPACQLSIGQGVKEPDHAHRDRGLFYEPYDGIGN
jgi:hypothetical protein